MAWSDAARAAALEARRMHSKPGKHPASDRALAKFRNTLLGAKGSPSVYERNVRRSQLSAVHAIAKESGRSKDAVARTMFHGSKYKTLTRQAGRK